MERKQLVDVGKYLSLEEALNYIKEESFNMQVEQEKKATASIIAKPTKGAGKLSANSSTGSLTSLRRNKRGCLREACAAGGDDALSTELDDGTGRSEVSGRSLRSAEVKAEEQSEDSSSKGYDELWCSHCLDDKSVLLCAFCGCKKCYGKYDSNLLILCDHCERETHTYCLDPALSEVPTEDPWYCQSCLADGVSEAEGSGADSEGSVDASSGAHKRRKGSVGGASVGERSQISGEDDDGQAPVYKKWGRGRKKVKVQESADNKMRNVNGKCQGKAVHASPAGMSGNQQPRGRGRPPGSGKRLPPTTSGVFSSGVSMAEASSSSSSRSAAKIGSQSEPPVASKGRLKRSASSTCSVGGEEDSRSEGQSCADATASNDDGSGSSSEGARMSVDDSTHDAEESERSGGSKSPDEVFEPGAPGISAALAVISRAGLASGKVDGGPWTEAELDILEQVRAWAPLQDIQRAHAALLAQKEILIKRIVAIDPLFDAKDLEALVTAQLTALATAQQESAVLDNVTVASACGSQAGGTTVLGAATAAPPKPKRSKPKPKATPAASASAPLSSAAPSGIVPTAAKAVATASAGAPALPSSALPAAAPNKKLSLANLTSATILPAPASSSHSSQEGGTAAAVPQETKTS